MLDPELPDALVSMRKSEPVGGFRVKKAGWIEIKPEPVRLCPGNPVLEIFRSDCIAICFFTGKLPVKRVKVQTVPTGNQRIGLLQIGAEFLGQPIPLLGK